MENDQILTKLHKMLSCMAFAHGINALMFLKFTHFEEQLCRVVYVKIHLFHLKLTKSCLMLGEF